MASTGAQHHLFANSFNLSLFFLVRLLFRARWGGGHPAKQLEELVHDNDRGRQVHDPRPLEAVERDELEDLSHERNVENHHVEAEREEVGGNQVHVGPRRHREHGLVLGDGVQRVQELDHDQDGQGHRHRRPVFKDIAFAFAVVVRVAQRGVCWCVVKGIVAASPL